jgi:putative effector of murein hydrolase
MSNGHQPAITIFAVALVAVLVAAIATTLQHVETKQVSNGMPLGTVGLAHPHPALDRAAGQAVK